MDRTDLILLHPPSVYDFRKRDDLIFPYFFSTIIQVSPMLEIFPIGFYNIESFLQSRNIKVKIYNLANMMLRDYKFRVEDFLVTLKPRIFGIDLHWLIHAHGALEICKLIKKVNKEIPILLGGMSASYFYKELIDYPFIDFIIRGSIVFHPLEQLMKKILKGNSDYSKIPNLCFKKSGKIVINSTKLYSEKNFHPIDWSSIRELKHKYTDFVMTIPTLGCQYNCPYCGGGREATKKYALQKKPLLCRSSRQILSELNSFRNLKKKSLIKNDLFIPGYWHVNNKFRKAILNYVRKMSFFSTLHLELFNLIPKNIIAEITKYTSPVLEISPESHDLNIRRICNRASYTNRELELWLEKISGLNIKRIIVYFMLGLPRQTRNSVMDTVRYCEQLLKKFKRNKKVIPFLSPMIPFLNPASPIFEHPDRYGYRLFYRTLKEHADALTQVSLKNRLNYETKWMTREQIVQVASDSAIELTKAKIRYGYLSPTLGKKALLKLNALSELIAKLDKIDSIKSSDRRLKALNRISNQVGQYNKEIMQSKFFEHGYMNTPIYNFWYEI